MFEEGTHLDWIRFLHLFLPPPVTFTLCLCALTLIEAQKPGEEIELQIELHPKVILALKSYPAAIELLPIVL